MKKQKRSAISDLLWTYTSGVVGAMIGLGIGVCAENAKNSYELSNYGYEKAMTQYEPVGNGEALSAIMGDISPRRAQMYQRMQETYENAVGEKALENIADYRYNDIQKRTQVKEGTRRVDDIIFIPFGY